MIILIVMIYSETIKLKGPEDTEALGRKIAESALPGEVYALVGDLGTGKTTLVQAVARGLGIKSKILSPTFTIVQEYDEGRLPLYHFDVYRVSSEDDLFELGFDEYLEGRGICLIEWADLIEELLPEDICAIFLDYGASEDERYCRIVSPLGPAEPGKKDGAAAAEGK